MAVKIKKITLKDVLDAFKKMNNQFDEMEKKDLTGRSYYYEGINSKKNGKTYEILWGS